MTTILKRLKQAFPAWLLCAAAATIIASCADDEWMSGNRRPVREGVPVTFDLNFCAEDNRVETRAAQDESNESRIYNLYVLIFDADGNKHYGQFFDRYITFTDGYRKGSVSVETTSLNNATVVCIANLTTDDGVHTDYNVTATEIQAIETLNDLKAYEATLENEDYERSTQFFMTGYGYETDSQGKKLEPESTSITIPDNLEQKGIYCLLSPRRMDAKVTFNVTPDRTKWTNLDFKPRTWRVVNVPKQTPLLQADDPTQHIADTKGDDAYFNTAATSFELEERDTQQGSLLDSCGFTFYMPESRLRPKKTIDATDLTGKEAYALREKREAITGGSYPDKPGQKYENGDFTYAADHAAYVEMTGTLSYTIPAGTTDNGITYPTDYTVNADVTLTVHLGYANKDPNDYRTLRNTHYTYNVSLRGLDNVVVEVTNDGDQQEEPRPGYEADVIFASDGVYTMDAHYDRQLITIDRSMVPKLTWGVQTPYTQGIYNISNYTDLSNTPDPGTVAKLYDYKWVKFAINSDYKVPEGQYVKYPGDQNYNGGTEGGGEPSPYYSPSGKDHASNADSQTEAARMYDIHGLLKRLKQEYTDGQTTGPVAITAFVDEYVYVKHPETGADILSQWSNYVDAEDRLLYFVNSENSQYSPDGNSSIVEAVKSFRQNPIRTVYNTSKGLKTAWGTESILNDDRLAPGNVSNGSSTSNGRLNTIQCLLGTNYKTSPTELRWSKILRVSFNNPDEHYMLQPGYQDAMYATLLRNRDLDGDDIVDYEEIRWYLAAIDQLVDLYIGEPALDSDAHLYPDDTSKLVNKHYTYTSSSNNGGNPWVYWSEECAALGSFDAAYGNMEGKFPYRCLRNIGIDITDPATEPTPLIPKVTQAETDGTYLIDCSNLSEKARRTSFEASSSLGAHDDESPQNRPYAKFRVSAGTKEAIFPVPTCTWGGIIGYTPSWNDKKWGNFQTQTPSGGYRTPNLRELLIMATRLPNDAWIKKVTSEKGWSQQSTMNLYYLTMTKFSRGGEAPYADRNHGFRLNPRDMTLGAIPNNEGNGYVRPVKDEM
ncbi:fimbrial protein [Mediterranea massiliensis]|uniref:fimbrial protein n=1 Tax=Mediterranea massiliensis TaxID=1841865 RepID=UPI003209DCBC